MSKGSNTGGAAAGAKRSDADNLRAKVDYDPDKATTAYTDKNRPDLAAQLLNPLGGYPTRSATSHEDLTGPPLGKPDEG